MKIGTVLAYIGLSLLIGAPIAFLWSWGTAQIHFPNGEVPILNAIAGPMTVNDLGFGMSMGAFLIGMAIIWFVTEPKIPIITDRPEEKK